MIGQWLLVSSCDWWWLNQYALHPITRQKSRIQSVNRLQLWRVGVFSSLNTKWAVICAAQAATLTAFCRIFSFAILWIPQYLELSNNREVIPGDSKSCVSSTFWNFCSVVIHSNYQRFMCGCCCVVTFIVYLMLFCFNKFPKKDVLPSVSLIFR